MSEKITLFQPQKPIEDFETQKDYLLLISGRQEPYAGTHAYRPVPIKI